jgi:hypothetical protein
VRRRSRLKEKTAMSVLAAALLAASSAAAGAHRHYDAQEATRLVPLLTEVLRFDTVAGHERAHVASPSTIPSASIRPSTHWCGYRGA